MVETESVSIRQICPETVILSHFSCQLTNVQRFTISAHYIRGAARGSRLCIRSASPARYVTKIMTRMPYRYAVGLMIKTDEVSEQGWCEHAAMLSIRYT
jgi:hypothetical protein